MILTVTMNPSVDISYPLDQLRIDSVNRVSKVRKDAGGKGLNVTRVIKQAGDNVLATGLVGGFFGNYIMSQLDTEGIGHSFSPIAQESRNCIAILHQGFQTEILEAGPNISPSELDLFLQHFSKLVASASTVTLSGSLPIGVPDDLYQNLITVANNNNAKVLLDSSGESLKKAITGPAYPYLIKPNKQELEQLTGRELDTANVKSFIALVNEHNSLASIPWIVVTLGNSGAFVKKGDLFFSVTIPEIKVMNAVGSGDATVAGLAVGINNKDSTENILKRAMAFGMLNAMESKTGCINMDTYERLFQKVDIHPYRS